MSFGFLSLAPLLAVGLTHSRAARENRVTSQIASTLIEQARQGALSTSPIYLDSAGNTCSSGTAAYVAQGTQLGVNPGGATATATASAPLTRLTLRVAPMDGAARIYADVYPTPP